MLRLSPLLVLLACFAACAGSKYHVDVGPFFAKSRGEVAMQNASGTLDLGQNKNDLDAFGLGDTQSSPYVRAQWDLKRHRVRAHGFSFGQDSNGTLDRDFGGLVAGSQVVTTMDFLAIDVNYAYELLRGKNYRFAGGVQLGYYALDLQARSAVGREELDTTVLVPMPFLELEGLFGPFTLGGNISAMKADLGDADGRYLDAEAYARWSVAPNLDFFGGYRFVRLDGSGIASGRAFDADMDVHGYFFGVGFVF